MVALLDGDAAEQDVLARVQRLCALCVKSTGTSGAALAISSDAHRSTVWATDGVAEQVEELQLTLSEGPAVDAVKSGRTVLVPDIASTTDAWPLFAPEAVAAGAGALFALPLQVGHVRTGVLSLYRSTAGELGHLQRLDAELCAEAAALLLCVDRGQHGAEAFVWAVGDRTRFQPQVHQAVGALRVQLDLAPSDAFARLCAHAFWTDKPIGQVGEEIVAGTLRLERDRPPR